MADGVAGAGAPTEAPERTGGKPPSPPPRTGREREYWNRNLRYVFILLVIWFVVSYGAGILFVEALNQIRIPGTGFPLGFWFAQQGSIYVFVALIFVYVFLMNRLDRDFDVHERDEGDARSHGGGLAGPGERAEDGDPHGGAR